MDPDTLDSLEWPVRYGRVREESLRRCAGLEVEDHSLQAEVFTSPPKWHLAHTSWFFETFLLKPFDPSWTPPCAAYEQLFNSYYNGIGTPFARERRGLLSRPGLQEVLRYRKAVDEGMAALLDRTDHASGGEILRRCRLGLEHEMQHQELLLTDLKYSLFHNPLFPAIAEAPALAPGTSAAREGWLDQDGGQVEIGATGEAMQAGNFAFDNECPRHAVLLRPFQLAEGLVTNADYQAFVDEGGYERPEFWLSDGWAEISGNRRERPLYWIDREGKALEYTLFGLRERDPAAPVSHLSAYEADAYARFAGARLPTEAEWEHAAALYGGRPTLPACDLHPGADGGQGPRQFYDSCWQWTASAYRPYPGYRVPEGVIGEYNGKFMCNQWVLRGGSCYSPPAQLRPSYRNFFYPADRWQCAGIRLAREA